MFYPLALVQYILFDVDPDVRVGLLYDIGCNFESHLRHVSNMMADPSIIIY